MRFGVLFELLHTLHTPGRLALMAPKGATRNLPLRRGFFKFAGNEPAFIFAGDRLQDASSVGTSRMPAVSYAVLNTADTSKYTRLRGDDPLVIEAGTHMSLCSLLA